MLKSPFAKGSAFLCFVLWCFALHWKCHRWAMHLNGFLPQLQWLWFSRGCWRQAQKRTQLVQPSFGFCLWDTTALVERNGGDCAQKAKEAFFPSICYRILMELFTACCPITRKAVPRSTEKGILASSVWWSTFWRFQCSDQDSDSYLNIVCLDSWVGSIARGGGLDDNRCCLLLKTLFLSRLCLVIKIKTAQGVM